MDALIPVFVAVIMAETGGRIQGLTAALHDRFPGNVPTIFAALALTSLISLIVAAIGGAIVADMIDFRARTLLAGLALAFAGAPMLFALKPSRAPEMAPLAASLRAFAPAQFGDASQFIVFAIAAMGDAPALALAAGIAAILAAASMPLLAGEWPGRLPLAAIRRGLGTILLIAGAAFAAHAFRVI